MITVLHFYKGGVPQNDYRITFLRGWGVAEMEKAYKIVHLESEKLAHKICAKNA